MKDSTTAALDRRLEIFVSSTIGECAAERSGVKQAILSLNFDPVLFEDVGARPYPPREVYGSRLRDSEIFVAIYREQYGWIAPGMTISGIEDEFNIAEEVGLPRLVYVFKTPSSRADQLATLVERAKEEAGLTIWHYAHPEELRDKVREDITALVSRNFRLAAAPAAGVPEDDDLSARLVPETERFRRSVVERELLAALQSHRILQVTGEMGVGKTMLLAMIAADQNWVFASGRGRTPTELAQRLITRFAAEFGETSTPPLAYRAALAAAAALWKRLGARTVAIDDCPSPTFVEDLLDGFGEGLADVVRTFAGAGVSSEADSLVTTLSPTGPERGRRGQTETDEPGKKKRAIPLIL